MRSGSRACSGCRTAAIPLLRIHEVRAGRLRVSTLTMGEGPDVILMHGLGATKASFFDMAAALSRGHRVHAIDLPGFGSSSKPTLAPYNVRWYASTVARLMDVLEIERAHLVGNSMGGRIALELGLARPDRVGGIVGLAPAVAWLRRDFHRIVRLLRPELGLLPHKFTETMVRNQFWDLFADPDLLDPALADVIVDEFQRIYGSPGARLAFLSMARNIYLESPFGAQGFYPRLSELRAPALFVWGSHDRLVPAGFARHVASGCRARSRSCSRAAATCRRSSAASRRTGWCGGSSRASTRSAGPAARSPRHDHDQRTRGLGTGGVMSSGSSTRAAADRNGRVSDPAPPTDGAEALERRAAIPGAGLLRAVAGQIERRIPRADLDERDPDYIRDNLPFLWMVASLYYRGEVRGLGNIPEDGPVLLVGNHSGGNMTPDTIVFTLAFNTYFGVERRFHQLAHNLVLSMPGLASLRKYGTVAASPQNAEKALQAGAAVLVYPGGDVEVHRPFWERNKVDFAGRRGFVRLALKHDVPIVPVVSIGGQETSLFLSRGRTLSRTLGIDKITRMKVLPISIALPWGLNVGDMLGHIPLPAKITVEALPPIHMREEFGDEPDVDEVYEHVTRLMQETLDALAAERRWPLIG